MKDKEKLTLERLADGIKKNSNVDMMERGIGLFFIFLVTAILLTGFLSIVFPGQEKKLLTFGLCITAICFIFIYLVYEKIRELEYKYDKKYPLDYENNIQIKEKGK